MKRRLVALQLAWLVPTVGLTGCLGTAGLLKKDPDTPAWVLNPPADTSENFFGVGEGQDLAAAKRAALKDIAARMKVVISGTTSSQIAVRNGQVSQSAANSVTEEVDRIEFRNHVLVQSAPSSNGFLALVKVDKQQFRAETRERIGRLRKVVDASLARLQDRTLLDQYAVLTRSKPNLRSLATLLQLIGTGAQTAEERDYSQQVDEWLARADAIVTQLVVIVAHTPADAEVGRVLSSYLADNGIRLTSKAAEANTTLGLSVAQRNDDIQGAKVTRLTVSLTLSDSAGQVRATYNRIAAGSSLVNHEAARTVALRVLSEDLKKDGVLKVLGLPTA